MPKVPQYNQQVQNQAAPSVQFNPNAPIEAFGGGRAAQEAGAVRELAGVASQIAIKAREDADDVAFAEQAEKLKRARIDLEMNPERGLLNRRGKDAFNLGQESEESWEKASSEILASAPNDRVRERLSRAKAVEGLSMYERVQSHVSREMRAHDAETTKALTETAVNDAILNKDNPDQIDFNLSIAKDTLAKFAARDGKDAAWLERTIAETTSKAHATMIGSILDQGDDRKARAHFERYKDQINDAATLKQVEAALEDGSLRGESQRTADDIVMKYGDDLGSALKAARGIEDPKLRDETTTRVKQTISDIRAAKSMRTEDLHKSASQIIDKTGNYDSIPANILSQFSLAEKSSLKAYAKARKENTLETNWGDYYQLKTMAADSAMRPEFLRTNLHEKYRASMADAEFKELVNLQTSLRNGDKKAERELDGYLSTKDIVDGALRAADIDPSPKEGSKDADKANRFRLQVNTELKRIEAETGKKPTSDDEVKIVSKLLTKVVTDKGWLWDTKKKAFEVDLEDIPRDKMKGLEDTLRKNKVPVTDENVLRLYQSKLRENVNGNK